MNKEKFSIYLESCGKAEHLADIKAQSGEYALALFAQEQNMNGGHHYQFKSRGNPANVTLWDGSEYLGIIKAVQETFHTEPPKSTSYQFTIVVTDQIQYGTLNVSSGLKGKPLFILALERLRTLFGTNVGGSSFIRKIDTHTAILEFGGEGDCATQTAVLTLKKI